MTTTLTTLLTASKTVPTTITPFASPTEMASTINLVTATVTTVKSPTTTVITSTSTSTITETSDTTYQTTTLPTTVVTSAKETDFDNEIISTGNTQGFPGNLRRNTNSKLRRSPSNLVELNIIHSEYAERKTRSIVDYVIARYYDDRYDGIPNQRPYVPVDQPSFLVYGKYREYNIDFIRYDTVLPFYYIPHLDTLALRFPLDNTNYYLLLLLPVDERGIDQLICNLRLNGSLRYIIGNLRYQHVIATIPSFMLKGYVTLTPTLQKVGSF